MNDNLGPQGPVSAKGFGTPAAPGNPGSGEPDPNLAAGPANEPQNNPPQPGSGAPQGPGATPPAAPGAQGPGTETFLTLDDIEDPKVREAVSAILGPREKQMQAAFTKRTQAISADRQKIEAYDNFLANPQAVIRQVAQQYGLQLVDGNGQGAAQTPGNGAAGSNPFNNPDYQPQSWAQLQQDMTAAIVPQIVREITQHLGGVIGPLYQNVEKITSNHVETQLDAIDTNWRIYEDEIKSNMKLHPTLLKDPQGVKKLYTLSVPDEVLFGKATQTALTKLQDKGEALKTGTKTQTRVTQPAKTKVESFDDAVRSAKRTLGIT